ncbi:MAG TPA: GIY-YIG nuclease family protein [Fimbriimonadaceae bacterium]|nr:GIY-YIG nuclease family protein [Fimbriimonadaceae bacterium]
MEANEALADLGFPPLTAVWSRRSIADLYRPGKRCGIYVLEFETGELYCGQAVDVTRRYVQHRKVHTDIRNITFQPVAPSLLDDTEIEAIAELERAGWALRNIALTSIPKGESDFDLVMSLDDQAKWLEDVSFRPKGGIRVDDADVRRKHARNADRFRSFPFAHEATQVLAAYIDAAIPLPHASELSFWSCSCLPGNNNSVTIYSRVNLNMQEVLTLGVDEGVFFCSWHLSDSPFYEISEREVVDLIDRLEIWHEDHWYKPGGPDQVNVGCDGVENALRVLSDPLMVRAMRLMNLRLMKKGPTYYSRAHCFGLVDAAYAVR